MKQLLNLASIVCAHASVYAQPLSATLIFPSLTLAELFVSLAEAIQGNYKIERNGMCVKITACPLFPEYAHDALARGWTEFARAHSEDGN